MAKISGLKQKAFLALLKQESIPAPESEFHFHPTRKWRTDFCWPGHKLMLEVEGGVWSGGRHVHPAGFIKDMEKYNAAAALGYRLIRCQPSTLTSRDTISLISRILTEDSNA